MHAPILLLLLTASLAATATASAIAAPRDYAECSPGFASGTYGCSNGWPVPADLDANSGVDGNIYVCTVAGDWLFSAHCGDNACCELDRGNDGSGNAGCRQGC